MPTAMVEALRKPIFPAKSARSPASGRFPKSLQKGFTGIWCWIPDRRSGYSPPGGGIRGLARLASAVI